MEIEKTNKLSFEKTITELMCFSRNTFFVWKRENRPVMNLLKKYFSKEELQEFLETGKIQKQELVKDLTVDELNSLNNLKEQLILDEIKRTEEKLEELKALRNNITSK